MKKIIIFLTVLLVISAVFYKTSLAPEENIENDITISTTSEDISSTTEKSLGETIKVGGAEFQVIEKQLEKPSVEAPSLTSKIIFPDRVSAESRKIITTRIDSLVSQLKKDPLLYSVWNDLALEKQSIDDYKGAEEIWKYNTMLNPTDPLAFSNLGNLYGYYLHDNIKAETNYMKSMELGKNNGFWYYQAFMFYKEALKDDVKARAIIEEGVKNNPSDEDLKNILKSL